jgi:two-component system chemotaxis response regulator CheY
MHASIGDHRPAVLVAEDNFDIRVLLTIALEGAGYRVIPASDGVEALGLAASEGFDLILIDASMPRLDGVGFCRAYRTGGGAVPIVLVSAASATVLAETAGACGAAASIRKPFGIGELLATVAQYAERRPQT